MTTIAAAPMATPAMAPEERPLDVEFDDPPEPDEFPLPELLPELPLPPEFPFPEFPLPEFPSRPPLVGDAPDDDDVTTAPTDDVLPCIKTLTQMTLTAESASATE